MNVWESESGYECVELLKMYFQAHNAAGILEGLLADGMTPHRIACALSKLDELEERLSQLEQGCGELRENLKNKKRGEKSHE